MDSITTDGVKRLIDEALKQSPNNPQSNGYGFALATMAGFCVLLLVVVWFLYRDQKRERKQARTNAAKQIDDRFDKLEGCVNTGLDDIQKETKLAIADLQGKYVAHGQELTRLKTIIEMQKGGK